MKKGVVSRLGTCAAHITSSSIIFFGPSTTTENCGGSLIGKEVLQLRSSPIQSGVSAWDFRDFLGESELRFGHGIGLCRTGYR